MEVVPTHGMGLGGVTHGLGTSVHRTHLSLLVRPAKTLPSCPRAAGSWPSVFILSSLLHSSEQSPI